MTRILPSDRPLRLLFLCTGNSARSQMAEYLLNKKGAGRFVAESAGSNPAAAINPMTVPTLQRHGADWPGHAPRGLDGLAEQEWDFVITVCDNAREACPYFPRQPVMAHWGMPDPAAVDGTIAENQRAFDDAYRLLSRRIDLLLSLPLDQLESLALTQRVQAIGEAGAEAAQLHSE